MVCLACAAQSARVEDATETRGCASCELAALPAFDTDKILARVAAAEAATQEAETSGTFAAKRPAWWRALSGPAALAFVICVLAIVAVVLIDERRHWGANLTAMVTAVLAGFAAVLLQGLAGMPTLPFARTTPPKGLRAYLRALQAGKPGLAWEYVLPAGRARKAKRRAFEHVHVTPEVVEIDSADDLGTFWAPLMRRTACGLTLVRLEGFGAFSVEGRTALAVCRVRMQHACMQGGAALGNALLRWTQTIASGGEFYRPAQAPTEYVWLAFIMRKVGRQWFVAHPDLIETRPETPEDGWT